MVTLTLRIAKKVKEAVESIYTVQWMLL